MQESNYVTFVLRIGRSVAVLFAREGARVMVADMLADGARETAEQISKAVGRYVIGQDGIVAYAEVNPDYTRRPDPDDLYPILDRLARSKAA